MKQSILKVLSGVLAVSFAFSASGCELFDSIKNLFGDKEQSVTGTAEENEAFKQIKSDVATFSNYKGAFTLTTKSEGNIKAQSESGSILQEVSMTSNEIRSIDFVNKKGVHLQISEQSIAGEKETREVKEKLFEENGKYYSYYLDESQGDEAEYSEVSSKKVNETFANSTIDALGMNLYDSELGCYFLADTFDELKKAHVDVYKESVEKQKVALQEINDSIEKQKNYLNPNSSTYKEQCAALDAKKKDLNSVKADVSLTAYEKDGANTFKIVSDMATDTIDENDDSFATLKLEQTITTKDGKLVEYVTKMDVVRSLTGGMQSLTNTSTMKFDYSFNQQKYDEMTVSLPDESEIDSEKKDEEITFHVKVGDKEFSQVGYVLPETTTALEALTELQERYFGASVTMGQKIYVNAERTQEFDVLNSSVEDLLATNELYIEVTVNDGYVLLFNNGITQKDVTEKKYKLISGLGNYYVSSSKEGVSCYELEKGVSENKIDFSDSKYSFGGVGFSCEREYAEIYANGKKLENKRLVLENKGFYVIDYVAEIENLNPTVFNSFYNFGLY